MIAFLTTRDRIEDRALVRPLSDRGHTATLEILVLSNTPGEETSTTDGLAVTSWPRTPPSSLDPLALHDALARWVLGGVRRVLQRRLPDAVVLLASSRWLAHLGRDAVATLHPRLLLLIARDDEVPQARAAGTRIQLGTVSADLAARVHRMTNRACLLLAGEAEALAAVEAWIASGAAEVEQWRIRVTASLPPLRASAAPRLSFQVGDE